MISLCPPKIFILLPSHAEFDPLLGLLRSSRSTFSPSLTAHMCRTDAEALKGNSNCVRSNNRVTLLALVIFINKNLLDDPACFNSVPKGIVPGAIRFNSRGRAALRELQQPASYELIPFRPCERLFTRRCDAYPWGLVT